MIKAAKEHPSGLWRTLSNFLRLPTTGLNISRFPHDAPGGWGCKPLNAVATYTVTTSSTDYTDYAQFRYLLPALAFMSALEGCDSSVAGDGQVPIGELLTPPWQPVVDKGVAALIRNAYNGECIGRPAESMHRHHR